MPGDGEDDGGEDLTRWAKPGIPSVHGATSNALSQLRRSSDQQSRDYNGMARKARFPSFLNLSALVRRELCG